MHACHQKRSEEGTVASGTRVTDDCEPSYRSWELNPDPLEGQSVLLTPETSLHPL